MREQDFLADAKTLDAVERCLARISEAAIKLGADAERLCPQIPWRDIRGIGTNSATATTRSSRREYGSRSSGILRRSGRLANRLHDRAPANDTRPRQGQRRAGVIFLNPSPAPARGRVGRGPRPSGVPRRARRLRTVHHGVTEDTEQENACAGRAIFFSVSSVTPWCKQTARSCGSAGGEAQPPPYPPSLLRNGEGFIFCVALLRTLYSARRVGYGAHHVLLDAQAREQLQDARRWGAWGDFVLS